MATEYWIQKDGTRISVDDMTTEHLRNTLKMIIRNSKKPNAERKIYPALNGDMAQEFNGSYCDES
jgi:hypothetical protein